MKVKEDSDDEIIILAESPNRDKKNGKSPAKQKSEDDDEVIIVSESIKKAPSSSKRKKLPVKRNYDYDDYDDDLMIDGLFDGMAKDDAAALCECFLLKSVFFNFRFNFSHQSDEIVMERPCARTKTFCTCTSPTVIVPSIFLCVYDGRLSSPTEQGNNPRWCPIL